MKTLIAIILFIGTTALGQAQKDKSVTVLPEIKIKNSALWAKVTRDGDKFTFKIDKAYALDFVHNPITFMKSHLDMKNFIAHLSENEYDSYQVTFNSRKGYMIADFDEKGNLISTKQIFKNILLPYPMRGDIYLKYKGWTMTKNRYEATTKGENFIKRTIHVTHKKGKLKETITIDGAPKELTVAKM